MLQRLQQKWKVSGIQVVLILCTFAIGGSLTGLAGKKLMNFFEIQHDVLWIITYIILITILWPFSVLIISIFFGQYRFFIKYLQKIGRRIGIGYQQPGPVIGSLVMNSPNKETSTKQTFQLAIFASGAGSNAQKIIDYFRHAEYIKVALIVCNKPGAGVLNIATKEKIPVLLIEKEKFFRGSSYTEELKDLKIDLIILAGFLWKIPDRLIKAFPSRIINIHPALLPKYGGRGMYGHFVHEAVIGAGEKESGITIHYVDEKYDHGAIIFQAKCDVLKSDTSDLLAQKIHLLEHQHFPVIIDKLINNFSKAEK